ncbi:MAG: hypothetical protein PHH04_07425 [Thomasclavelia sp.]|nr:hypothetical protein [Thomasclavelia sp.]
MKKIIVFFVAIMMSFSIVGCSAAKDKEVLSVKDFETITTKEGFTYYDITSQYSYSYLKNVSIAKNSTYQIEFYQYDTSSRAKSSFDNNKDNLENDASGSKTTKSTNLKNYNTYSITDSYSYGYLCRVENTMIYVNTKKAYKDDVVKVLKKLGY